MLDSPNLLSNPVQQTDFIRNSLVSSQRKSLQILIVTFSLISCLEFAYFLHGLILDHDIQWPLPIKILVDFLSLIALFLLFKKLVFPVSKAKNHLLYFLCWLLILNQFSCGFAEAYLSDDFKEHVLTFLGLLAVKVLIIQIVIFALHIQGFLKVLPSVFMIVLSLGLIAANTDTVQFFLEVFLCFLGAIFMIYAGIQKNAFLYQMIFSKMDELSFCKNIIKNIPVGVMLINRDYQVIYQNNQMQNYFATLDDGLRNPRHLFRQFKGAEVPEEDLMTFFKDALNQKLEDATLGSEVCLEDVLEIMFKNHKIVENALKGNNHEGADTLQNSIKFFMNHLNSLIQVKVYPLNVGNKECALLLFKDHTERIVPLLGGDTNAHYLFLASLSHELRTPLNSALALIQSSVQEQAIPADVKDKLLTPALSSIQILSYSIKDIIDYSKLSVGALGLRLETCSVAALVDKCVKLVEIQAKKKKVSIFTKIDPDVPTEWCTDPERVCQVVLNLLTNGLKYTLKGKGSIVISVKYLEKKGLISIKVSDSGIGMEKNDLSRLQKAFKEQELFSSKLNPHSTGIGLGLTVSNQICLSLGTMKYDYLQVESTSNKGSEFRFYIENKTKINILSSEYPGTIETHESLLTEGSNFKFRRSSKRTSNQNRYSRYSTRKESIFSPKKSQKAVREFPSKESEELDADDHLDQSLDRSSDSSPSLYANTILLTQQYLSFESQRKKPDSRESGSRSPDSRPKTPTSRTNSPLLNEIRLLAGPKTPRTPRTPKARQIQKVLIVDDDSFNILSLELMFKKLKVDHDHAYNGKEAIEKALTNEYDLIMMDCNMPVMDGWEATQRILKLIEEKQINDLVIVACTAFDDAENLMKCGEAGMKYIIQKPVHSDKLSDLLKKLQSSF